MTEQSILLWELNDTKRQLAEALWRDKIKVKKPNLFGGTFRAGLIEKLESKIKDLEKKISPDETKVSGAATTVTKPRSRNRT